MALAKAVGLTMPSGGLKGVEAPEAEAEEELEGLRVLDAVATLTELGAVAVAVVVAPATATATATVVLAAGACACVVVATAEGTIVTGTVMAPSPSGDFGVVVMEICDR